jgi:hypothetical protein
MRVLTCLFLLSMIFHGCGQRDFEMHFDVHAGDYPMVDAPVYAILEPNAFEEGAMICLHSDNEIVPGQMEDMGDSGQRLWWVVNLEPGETATYRLQLSDECYPGEFEWEQIAEHSTRLFFNDQPVIQYEHPAFDYDDIEGTKKPFHHVFEPTGEQLITKGGGGLYPHHRGIFFGYNHVYLNDDERVDIWHARDGERSEHIEVVREYGGPVMGGHEVVIHWKDREGTPFIEETRKIRVFSQVFGSSLIDFHSTLRAVNAPIRLEGDRQHAGVQFRAAQYVADNRDDSRFIRPADWSHVDGTREIEGEDMYDLPWNAMHFGINGKLFTVAYMSHPANPPYAEMSERLYGRFGEFFPYLVTAENPLEVNYRFWITEGEAPSIDEIDFRYQVYATPPIVAGED